MMIIPRVILWEILASYWNFLRELLSGPRLATVSVVYTEYRGSEVMRILKKSEYSNEEGQLFEGGGRAISVV
jgi:hypothetical protein